MSFDDQVLEAVRYEHPWATYTGIQRFLAERHWAGEFIGYWLIPSGKIYASLARLEKRGVITSQWMFAKNVIQNRKIYAIAKESQ